VPGLKRNLEAAWERKLNDCVISASFTSDGEYLAAAEVSGRVLVYETKQGRLVTQIAAHGFGTTAVAWRPYTMQLATAGQDGKARIWDGESGALKHELDGGSAWVEGLAWSPTGNYLATAAGRKLRLWRPDGEMVSAAADYKSTIADLEWMPATARYPAEVLAYCGYGGLVFWRPELGQAYKTFEYKGSMLKIRWSPDACYIGTGNQDASMQFFVLPEGIEGPSRDLVMWGYRTKILDMAWDPTSRYLATGGSSTIVVWDCSGKGPAGTRPGLLDYHVRLISELSWQAAGPLLASGCEEGLVALWRPGKDDRPLATDYLGAAISQLHWSPGDRYLLAASEEGDLRMYPGGGL
jgi:WD40 repeat protein